MHECLWSISLQYAGGCPSGQCSADCCPSPTICDPSRGECVRPCPFNLICNTATGGCDCPPGTGRELAARVLRGRHAMPPLCAEMVSKRGSSNSQLAAVFQATCRAPHCKNNIRPFLMTHSQTSSLMGWPRRCICLRCHCRF